MTTYLGQRLPPINTNPFTQPNFKETFCKAQKIQVYVASFNVLKVNAAIKAVEMWAKTFADNVTVEAKGYDCSSEINEQPIGRDYTRYGADNRLNHLRKDVENQLTQSDNLYILMAMENGLMEESVTDLCNPDTFETSSGMAWIDRCIVVGKIIFGNAEWDVDSISEGVTTPRECVEYSSNTNWAKTAGSFIEKIYRWEAKDWHHEIAGKCRQDIMKEANLSALGFYKR